MHMQRNSTMAARQFTNGSANDRRQQDSTYITIEHSADFPYCIRLLKSATALNVYVLGTNLNIEMAEFNAPPNTTQVISEADTPWEFCTSAIQYWMTSDINNPSSRITFLFTMALKGMEPARDPQ